MTPAQVSRAAAQVVRACTHTHYFDALYVVNSLHHSQQLYGRQDPDEHHGSKSSKSPPPPSPPPSSSPTQAIRFNPIEFGQAVSPRLSAHCLLHELIRRGENFKAGCIAELMMRRGIRIRKTSLEKIMGSFITNSLPSLTRQPLRRLDKYAAAGLTIHPEHFINPGNRAAYRILMHARKYGQDRSRRMYESLISNCLMQGEIIVGTLLFVLLVKDWQAHAARKAAEHSDAAEDDSISSRDHAPVGGRVLQVESDRFKYIPPPPQDPELWRGYALTPYPNGRILKRITGSIERALRHSPDPGGGQAQLQEPLQALANLVLLVQEGHIHFGHISPIIRAIIRCPKTQERIWIRKGRHVVQVDGYGYLHGFLLRIIRSFEGKNKLQYPPLDKRCYNFLLHYALRHRLSPSLASTILDHMCTKRRLGPTIETYNILLRSGTLLRRSDMTSAVLGVLGQDERSFGKLVATLQSIEPLPSSDTPDQNDDRAVVQSQADIQEDTSVDRHDSIVCVQPQVRGRLALKLYKLQREGLELPEQIRSNTDMPLADPFTLSSFIAYLVATGRPHLMADAVFYIFPELNYQNEAWAELTPKQALAARSHARDECVKRAAYLGPVFFAALLNALSKAGRTGLAERIWLLAVEAEQASWIPDFCPGVKPWRLPIHAYTSMLQCYARESSRGARRSEPSRGMFLDLRPNMNVRGWGRFLRRSRREAGMKRCDAGRELGLMLFRSVVTGKHTRFQTVSEIRSSTVARARRDTKAAEGAARRIQVELDEADVHDPDGSDEPEPEDLGEAPIILPHLRPPAPDARFFNAALRLFGVYPSMSARPVHASPTRARRLLRRMTSAFARSGELSADWTPGLQEVAEAMVRAGYPVPDGLRHVFVGRWEPGTMSWDPPASPSWAPFAYGETPKSSYREFSISIEKTRGLPMKQRTVVKRRECGINCQKTRPFVRFTAEIRRRLGRRTPAAKRRMNRQSD
ncbi:hypothetical protein EIP86_010330 [Pleurotus ostreatoroseus]|nr:hypothetical protein EIP86_010330 [Pleurotus ostreatoroseus]